MRTRTIFEAFREVVRRTSFYAPEFRIRQRQTFERELLRRMDERDAVIPAAKDAEQKHMAWAVCPKKDAEQMHTDWDASMWDLRLALYPVEVGT